MIHLNYKLFARIFGILLLIEAFFMMLSGVVSIIYREADLMAFIISALITGSVGSIMFYYGRTFENVSSKRDGFFIVAMAWVIFSLFGMLPYLLSGTVTSVTDSFFETMSGFTTTGATLLQNINSLPHGVLFWRSLTQWLGGMGIIVFTVAILPIFHISSGLQLYNAESSGFSNDRIRPRIQHTAKRLWGVYAGLTVVEIILLYLGPMDCFDAICHAFTSISSGGYSTHQESIGYFHSSYIEYILCIFMFISGINFTLVYCLFSKKINQLTKDEEFRWYCVVVCIMVIAFMLGFWITNQQDTLANDFRSALFHTISTITSTGYSGMNSDFVAWGPLFWILTLFIMIVGASAGSTSGGIKLVRLMILLKNTVNEFYRQIHPRAVVPVHINDHVISFETVSKVLAFVFVYALLSLISILLLVALGLSFDTAIGSAITCISNGGVGMGDTGPSGSFAIVPAAGKWFCSFLMLVGRLEIFTVLVLFSPNFWRKQ